MSKDSHPPIEPAPDFDYRIHSITPATGDWFLLEIMYGDDPSPRLFIKRVCLWALVQSPEEVPHVNAICETGMPDRQFDAKELADRYFVFGPDDSSLPGKTWSEAFASVQPNLGQIRELTGLFAAAGVVSPRRNP